MYILSILLLESGPLVSLLLIIKADHTSLVAATVCEFVYEGPAWNTRVSAGMKGDKWTHVNT